MNFKEFVEKDKYVSTLKKQLGIQKRLWLGMPILLSNVKLGKQMVRQPTMFYVKHFDDNSVTLVNVQKPESQDMDGEVDLDKSTIRGQIEVTIDMQDFYNLIQPQINQSTDTGSLNIGGM